MGLLKRAEGSSRALRQLSRGGGGATSGALLQIDLSGDREVADLLARLSASAIDRAVKPALRSGSAGLAEALRGAAPQETGLLKRAMGTSLLKTYPSVFFITAGVRRGFRRSVSRTRMGRWRVRGKRATEAAGQESVRNPAKYLHLVTGGRKPVEATDARVLYSHQSGTFFGRRAAAAPSNPFVERAFAAAGPVTATRIMAEAASRLREESARGTG